MYIHLGIATIMNWNVCFDKIKGRANNPGNKGHIYTTSNKAKQQELDTSFISLPLPVGHFFPLSTFSFFCSKVVASQLPSDKLLIPPPANSNIF